MLKQQTRKQKVLTLFKDGNKTPKQIIAATGYPISSVYKWCKEGVSAEDKPRSGRPKKFDEKMTRRIVQFMKGKRKRSTRKTAEWVQSKTGVKVSYRTIGNIAHNAGLHPHRPQRSTKLTSTHMKKRFRFAQQFLNHKWSYTVITDETQFSLEPSINTRNDIVWERKGFQNKYEQLSYPQNLRVWAGITAFGKTDLFFYSGTLNSRKYINILSQAKGPLQQLFRKNGTRAWWFQQDGASCHRSKTSIEWISKNFPHYISPQDWPPNSPDLSPIENLWGYIKDQLKNYDIKNLKSLKRKIRDIWNGITVEELKKLIKSIPDRLEAVIKNEGGHSGY